jgi:hypothetical protein
VAALSDVSVRPGDAICVLGRNELILQVPVRIGCAAVLPRL